MPLAIFLIPYGLFLLCFFIFALFALAHLFVFGEKNFTTFLATFLFIVASVLVLNTSWNLLVSIDWKEPVALIASLL
ncbi:hypothetical protein HY624_01665 [Candidatus Uhrbacteria bacterium]|nr:hypothetical protein [Candidatus Uhrbacteria bacterium]